MSDPHSPKFIIALCEAAAISVPHHNTTQHTSQSLYVLSSLFLLLLDAIFAYAKLIFKENKYFFGTAILRIVHFWFTTHTRKKNNNNKIASCS